MDFRRPLNMGMVRSGPGASVGAALSRFLLISIAAVCISSCAPSGRAIREPGAPPDPVMGDWQGNGVTREGMVLPLAVRAIALGDSAYRFVVRREFDRRGTPSQELLSVDVEAKLEGDRFAITEHPDWSASLDNGVIRGRTSSREADHFEIRHVVRVSPNLGATPPPGAVVLFDGSSLAGWEQRDPKQRVNPVGWTITDGVLQVGPGTGDIVTKRRFSDFQLHVEFPTPFMPEARGQVRGNSGVYLQGRYEVQVLDSYGLKGEDNECGGIYKVSAPRVNMCAPPGQWQTYDITFRKPRFTAEGTKTRDAIVTVLHNGVVIHQNLPIRGVTGGALDENVGTPGPLLLQDHGNLVQYRNIWLVELKDRE